VISDARKADFTTKLVAMIRQGRAAQIAAKV
jgi:hypothetical protein